MGTVRMWPPFPDQIRDAPVILPKLDVLDSQRYHLRSPETAANEHCDGRMISMCSEVRASGGEMKKPSLVRRKPVANTHTKTFRLPSPAYAGGEIGTQKTTICRFIG
jgi:hypothetical protein